MSKMDKEWVDEGVRSILENEGLLLGEWQEKSERQSMSKKSDSATVRR